MKFREILKQNEWWRFCVLPIRIVVILPFYLLYQLGEISLNICDTLDHYLPGLKG